MPRSESHLLLPVEVRRIAEALKEHNAWRRGEGKYKWKGDGPSPEAPMSAKELGLVIDEAVEVLEAVAEEREEKYLVFNFYVRGKEVKAKALETAVRIAPFLPHEGEARVCGLLVTRNFDRIRIFKDKRRKE